MKPQTEKPAERLMTHREMLDAVVTFRAMIKERQEYAARWPDEISIRVWPPPAWLKDDLRAKALLSNGSFEKTARWYIRMRDDLTEALDFRATTVQGWMAKPAAKNPPASVSLPDEAKEA